MPKIRNVTITARHKLDSKGYDLEVMYNQDNHFYIVIPDNFNQAFDALTEADLKTHHAEVYYKSRQDRWRGKEYGKRIVSSSTEAGAIDAAKTIIEKLLDSQIKTRNVIIVFYNSRGTQFGEHKYDKDYPQVSMQIGLTFCTEVTISGGKPTYYVYTEHEAFGEKYINKKQITIYNESCVVIDHTNENEKFVTELYHALTGLQKKLGEITKTPEALITMIESKQKLLSNDNNTEHPPQDTRTDKVRNGKIKT